MVTDQFELAQAELWPDRCPECGYMAYIGMNEVRCIVVGSCKNYDAKESQRWVNLRDELVPEVSLTDMLINPTLDELNAKVDAAINAMPVPYYIPTKFDWRDHVLNTSPLNPQGPPPWVYQLPANEAGGVNLNDTLKDVYGRDYRVVSIDRPNDQISVDKVKP